MADLPRHDDLIYDIGLHRGEDTEYYLRKGFRVVAFEADPDLIAQCKERFADALTDQRLTLIEGAIAPADYGDSVRFFKNPDVTVWGTIREDWAARNERKGSSLVEISVPTVDFARVLHQTGMPYYMKIDIEGMDLFCIETLRAFAIKPSYLSIESDKVDFTKIVEEAQMLRDLGFDRFMTVQQAGVALFHEPNPPREGQYSGYRFPEGSSGPFGRDLPADQWISYSDLINRYVDIFAQYRLFGDEGRLVRNKRVKALVGRVSGLMRRPLPGWYDTHARHSSAAS